VPLKFKELLKFITRYNSSRIRVQRALVSKMQLLVGGLRGSPPLIHRGKARARWRPSGLRPAGVQPCFGFNSRASREVVPLLLLLFSQSLPPTHNKLL
jgi:hypothetical protein